MIAGVPIGVVLTIPAVLSPRTCRLASRAFRFRAPSSLVITDPKLLSLPAHGAGLAVVFPASMKRVFRHDVARFAQFAERVWDVDHDFADPARTEVEGIRSMEVFREIGLPVTLEELGVRDDRYQEMARKCTERGPVGNFVKLGRDEVVEVYRLARSPSASAA